MTATKSIGLPGGAGANGVRGLLVITAHPDDEALIAGGTLAACAAAGLPTAVVCLTRGEEGPISDPALATRGTLGAVRVSELHAACAQLDVGFVRCYRHRDSELKWLRASAIARQLAAVIDELRPAAVITFGEDGLYWHPDHIAALEFTRRALVRVNEPPTLYRAAWPPTLMAELVAELGRHGAPADLWGIDPEDFGHEDATPLALDVTPFVERKLRALRAHRTQVGPRHAFAAIPQKLAAQYLGTEWFVEDEGRGWLQQAVARGRKRALDA